MTTNPRTLADELVAEIDEYRSGDDTLMTIPAGDIRALAQALRDAEKEAASMQALYEVTIEERDAVVVELTRLRKREQLIVKALGVPDGGQYINDIVQYVTRLREENERLRWAVSHYDEAQLARLRRIEEAADAALGMLARREYDPTLKRREREQLVKKAVDALRTALEDTDD